VDIYRRDFSFRGRTHMASAHWTKKGVKNVITFYLNMIWKHIAANYAYMNYDREEIFAGHFTVMDFHEWPHLFIRRESGIKGTYVVTDDCEAFIEAAHEALADCLTEPSFYPGGILYYE